MVIGTIHIIELLDQFIPGPPLSWEKFAYCIVLKLFPRDLVASVSDYFAVFLDVSAIATPAGMDMVGVATEIELVARSRT